MIRAVFLLAFAGLVVLADPAAAQPLPGAPPPVGYMTGYSPLVPVVDPFPSYAPPVVVRARYRVVAPVYQPPVVVPASSTVIMNPAPVPLLEVPSTVVVPVRPYPLRPIRRVIWGW